MTKTNLKTLALAGISALMLSACSSGSDSDSQAVIDQFEEAMVSIESGQMTVALLAEGQSPTELLDADIAADVTFDSSDPQAPKIDLAVTGTMAGGTQEQPSNGKIDAKAVVLGNDLYLQVNELEFDDPGFAAIQPVLALYMGQWLHLGEGYLPPELFAVPDEQEAEERERLFAEADMFKVKKDYGMENVNGHSVYHYEVELDKKAVQNYLSEAAAMQGQSVAEAELSQAVKGLSYIQSLELWIGEKDYYPYQAKMTLSGFPQINPETGEEEVADMTMQMSITAQSYNEPVEVSAPADAQEFDPLQAMMSASSMMVPEGEVETEEAQNALEDGPAEAEESVSVEAEAEVVE